MTLCYFDIETTGTNPFLHKIITIQYQCLSEPDLTPIGDLKILREWVNGEESIIRNFLSYSKLLIDPFEFIPMGLNTFFDLMFLYYRTRLLNPELVKITFEEFIYSKPFIDLKPILVIMNDFEFRELSKPVKDRVYEKTKITGKDIPSLYVENKYEEIENYVKAEAEEVIKLAREAYRVLNGLKPARTMKPGSH